MRKVESIECVRLNREWSRSGWDTSIGISSGAGLACKSGVI
jgi:hypothetical protein